jgi:MSHA pilin protein MshA
MRPVVCINALCPSERGFSHIELVVIITLVGFVAAFAIPRFTHLENDARASQIVALGVSLRNAAADSHEQYLRAGATMSVATLKGKVIQLRNGYPDAGSNGIRQVTADFSDFTASSTATSVTYFKTGAPNAASCTVTYNASSAPSVAATITGLNTSGC